MRLMDARLPGNQSQKEEKCPIRRILTFRSLWRPIKISSPIGSYTLRRAHHDQRRGFFFFRRRTGGRMEAFYRRGLGRRSLPFAVGDQKLIRAVPLFSGTPSYCSPVDFLFGCILDRPGPNQESQPRVVLRLAEVRDAEGLVALGAALAISPASCRGSARRRELLRPTMPNPKERGVKRGGRGRWRWWLPAVTTQPASYIA